MKKLLVLLFLGMFFLGCASATQSEFWEHDAMYKNFDHMMFSWSGYNNPTEETGKKSAEQGWWGVEVPYIPAK